VVATASDKGDKPKAKRKKERKAPAWMRQCEYSWDCEANMECCEFAGASFCCKGGVGIPLFDRLRPKPQPQMIPIPVTPPQYPQGYPGRYP
jgi:hypothetical protein